MRGAAPDTHPAWRDIAIFLKISSLLSIYFTYIRVYISIFSKDINILAIDMSYEYIERPYLELEETGLGRKLGAGMKLQCWGEDGTGVGRRESKLSG